MWGNLAVGFKLTNILLHAGCVVLLFRLVRRLLATVPPVRSELSVNLSAGVAALVFGFHPATAEAVCVVSFREDLLATGLLLLALDLASLPLGVAGWRRWLRGVVVCLACLWSIAAKESGIAAAPCLAVLGFLVLGQSSRDRSRRRWWLATVGVAGAAAVLFLVARFSLTPTSSAIFPSSPPVLGGSYAAAAQLQPRIFVLYAQLLVVPVGIAASYGSYSMRHLPLWLSLMAAAVVIPLLGWGCWRSRRLRLAVAIGLFGILPVSNLVPIYIAAADRYLYLPLAGYALAVAVLVAWLWDRLPALAPRAALVSLVGAALAWHSVLLVERERLWGDPAALWKDALIRNPASHAAANNLGYARYEQGRYSDAVTVWFRAVKLTDGRQADSWAGLALGLQALGRDAEARVAISKALACDPDYAHPQRLLRRLVAEPFYAAKFRSLALRHGCVKAGDVP